MWQYTFYPKDIIKIGDSIHKGSEEKYLFIFRKDSTGNYIVVDSIQPTGMYSWNYKT
jgi:sorbitol-specific phosphotransferase system component IIA